MKLTKLAILVTAATIALGVYSTKAAVPTVTVKNSKLNVSAIVITNSAEVDSAGGKWVDPIGKAKFGNKQLLALFGKWADKTWPAGAQLVIGWDVDYDVLVVDKTGTNILFDASTGITVEDVNEAYFYVDFWYEDGYGAGHDGGVDADPGYYAGTDWGTAYFELYDDYYLPYTDLSGIGGNTQTWKQSWNASDVYTTWSDSKSAVFPFSGDNYFLDQGTDVTVSGKISASGKGTGYNQVGWAD